MYGIAMFFKLISLTMLKNSISVEEMDGGGPGVELNPLFAALCKKLCLYIALPGIVIATRDCQILAFNKLFIRSLYSTVPHANVCLSH